MKRSGLVIIQSFSPDNYVLESAKTHDYLAFYEHEIAFRKMFEYPPFKDILLFELSSKDFSKLKEDTTKLYAILERVAQEGYKLYKPKSPYIQRINNKYRINIIAKCNFNDDITKIMNKVLELFEKDKNKNTGIAITRNPIFM